MSGKTIKIIGWILTVPLVALFLYSAYHKFVSTEGAPMLGLTTKKLQIIGVIEVLSAVLFVIPRTGILGTLLLAAYMGGAIATHVEHNLSVTAPVVVQCILWIVAVLRFPELITRITAKNTVLAE